MFHTESDKKFIMDSCSITINYSHKKAALSLTGSNVLVKTIGIYL